MNMDTLKDERKSCVKFEDTDENFTPVSCVSDIRDEPDRSADKRPHKADLAFSIDKILGFQDEFNCKYPQDSSVLCNL